MYRLIIDKSTKQEPPKRRCINCGHRDPDSCGGSFCQFTKTYIGYCETWDKWCKHWKKNKRFDYE